jgi:anti-sigma B factor antagonist
MMKMQSCIRETEENMEIRLEESSNITIINIKGEFHVGNVAKFEEVWHAQVEKKPKAIAINCHELEYIDSSAIGTLVKFLNNAMSKGIKLQFFDLNPSIQNIFKTARLDNFFTITTREKLDQEFK